ncbi:serpin B13-like [Copidosoma floridanum]|uniref:serpin B13-like n=1 Tax=Copidosoma floridanum TaxID=29053 RepID=UPI000C6F4C24|nr:serpin B13-like [Copidosoma floridanum]
MAEKIDEAVLSVTKGAEGFTTDFHKNEDLFMVIVVPNAIDGLEKIENNLEKLELQYEHFKYSRQEVNLSLPKFKVESTHELNAHLMELGMNEIFTERANFKGICDESVMVSKVMQKAFIEVNEEGSEAAADTQKVTLKIANKIYTADDVKIKDSFKKITGTYFRSESESLNFKKNVESAKAINGWCVEKTNGKIKEIVKSDDLDETTRLILLNAVYFKGDWKKKFDARITKEELFQVDATTSVKVPMMFINDKFYYRELHDIDAKVVALPYVVGMQLQF